ncbi:MAG TPA: hypothetical protein VJK72_04305 [Candidatus Nanoarchaeia archaeon]|nr:hypothetical protein [Candidatus Nanoarchaeia archaeon]
MKIVLDTSALMSLAAGRCLDLVVGSLECVIPERVREELVGLSRNNDFEGNLAKHILDHLDKEIVVHPSYKQSKQGEIECAYLANDLNGAEFLVTDDTLALEKLEKICTKNVRFSTLLIYALCLKDKITKLQAFEILERMRVKRNWKDNVIYEQALLLLERLPS